MSQNKGEKLGWTGERLITDISLGKGVIEHLHRYALAIPYAENKIVLDVACGEGYGSALLAQNASKVTGIDISNEAIEHARAKYFKENLDFSIGSVCNLPIESNSIDLIVSFETLEHLVEQEEMIEEFLRVLKPEGILIISTPERDNYNKVDPNNLFHLKELDYKEFDELLSKYFKNVNIFHQSYLNGTLIYPKNLNSQNLIEYSGNFEDIQKNRNDIHIFNIAICSNQNQIFIKNEFSYFNGSYILGLMRNESYKLGYNEALKVVRSSTAYKIGAIFTKPISKLFKKKK
jgi:2-polyprenyl-3-methyl-5-hydroxy-6-metoxy-1,4-benzoquinol methylase